MNSFVENVNYVANLDNKYGSSIKIYKNNLSLRTESHDLDFTLKYYNFDDKKIHNLEYSYSNILIENFNATLLNLKSQVDLTGLFDCDVSFNYTNFVINNIANISIFISSKTDNIKTCELNLKIRKDLNEIYNINGIVNDSMKILPYLASIDSEIFNDIVTVSENIEDIQNAEENANTATTKANEASNSAISASASAASALASKVSAENSATTATTKASEASISSDVASNQAGIATTKATEASSSANSASASENKAEKWAIELEDIPVEPGKYSAMHWALKAQVFAEGNSANISYDNVDSGLIATNVQDAIDELDESIDWLTDNTYTKTEANTLLALKINNSEKGVANGVATLDVNGKVTLTQIPDSVLGQLEYIGTWNFTTMPTATQKGQYWIANTGGNGYVVGDWAVWNGSSFDKVDNTDAVASVAGRIGNVVLTKSDVGLANVDNTADSAKPVSTSQQTALNLKANLASPVFTGNVTGLGVATGTSFNSITGLSSIVGTTSGTAAVGTSTTVARADHVHPSDTTKVTKVTSTDKAIVRFNGVTGDIQNSGVVINDNDATVNNSAGLSISPANGGVTSLYNWLDTSSLDIWAGATQKTGIHINGQTASGGSYFSVNTDGVQRMLLNENGMTIAGAISSSTNFIGALTGNAETATKLQTPRTISMSGAINGTATSFDGSANITIPTTVSTTQGGIVYGSSATAYGTTAAGTSGYILSSNGSSAPTWVENTLLAFPGSTFKRSVRAATTANITLNSPVTIDGIALVAGDRVLVKDQITASRNGIYVVAAGAWTRTTDSDSSSDIASAVVAIDEGTANGGRLFTTKFKATDTLGTTAMVWYEVVYNSGTWAINTTGSAATLTTGRTIGMTGDVTWTSGSFNGSADVTGTATLANTGVVAGTYKSVTVDGKGRVTSGTNPTTLAGYGIADAYTKAEVVSEINKIEEW